MKNIFPIIISAMLVSCSHGQSQQTNDFAQTDTVANAVANVVTETVETVDTTVVGDYVDGAAKIAMALNHYSCADEAYDDGYENGYQEGYTDATHHFDLGYNYDDESDKDGYPRSYQNGYAEGYLDGYEAGVEWCYEND